MRITYIAPLSVAKVALLLYGALGLVAGGIFAVAAVLGAAFSAAAGEESAMFGAIFGVGAVLAMPILYGVMGLLMAWLYNVVAGFVGGVEVRTDSTATV